MKNYDLKLSFTEWEINQLPVTEKDLYTQARNATLNAYAPYSNFQVGAACLLDNGEIFTASNQENAAYPSGLCAERSLLFYVGANRPEQKILLLSVSVESATKDPAKIYSPCGACRQVMAEYETRQKTPIRIMFEAGNGKVLIAEGIQHLLPFIFSF